ncbi:hypothetical protein [Massilia sp. CT11-137]|uniref:hypothetical protein n=1 Tax=Massilia sp. CT11-137 TaxID=3393901 RepID=UPI0039B0AE77
MKSRFPLAELWHTFLTGDGTAFCGVIKTNEHYSGEEPLRFFFVDLDAGRVRITGDLDVNATTYLSKCAVDPNSKEASSIRERWAETEKALKVKGDERRAQAAQQRQHERWVNENADALRALQQATDDIQAGKR